jgi:hypothetical protein
MAPTKAFTRSNSANCRQFSLSPRRRDEAETGPTTVVASAKVQAATAVASALMAHSRAASGSAGGIPVSPFMELPSSHLIALE